MSKPKDPCKVYACKIQTCLKENSFIEEKCYLAIEDMRQCCLKWHKISLCCSGIDLKKDYSKLAEAHKISSLSSSATT